MANWLRGGLLVALLTGVSVLAASSVDAGSSILSRSTGNGQTSANNNDNISLPDGEDPTRPSISSPAPGTQLPGTDVTLQWEFADTSVQQWYVRAGRSAGGTEFANTRILDGRVRQYRLVGLPSNGGEVFVELSYKQRSGSWVRHIIDYQGYSGARNRNQPPVATGDTAGPLLSGRSLSIDVLQNDLDLDGVLDPSTVVLVSPPTAGSASVQPGGQILYAHDGISGVSVDSLTYSVKDDRGATSNVATVQIGPIHIVNRDSLPSF